MSWNILITFVFSNIQEQVIGPNYEIFYTQYPEILFLFATGTMLFIKIVFTWIFFNSILGLGKIIYEKLD